MDSSIFMIGGDNSLIQLRRSEYDSEDLMQRLLADHPSVLGLTGDGEGELLLIKREQEVPDADGGSARWSLDHLFIDRSGVPVLVEVKRASDTRARREVVAQMLDYAANGISYWPLPQLMEAFRQTSTEKGQDPDALLASLLGDGGDVENFWRQVESNLRSGRIRMVFVADRIPKELRRIVEFLNEQMRPAEVLAVEVEQYTAENGTRTLVPKLVGVTERAQSVKAVSGTLDPITVEAWLAKLAAIHDAPTRQGAERAIQWFRDRGCDSGPTKTQDALFIRVPTQDGKWAYPFFIRTTGRLETSLQYLKNRPAFASDTARKSLLDRLRALPGQTITTEKLTGWPAFPVSELLRDDLWQEFSAIANRVISQVAETNQPTISSLGSMTSGSAGTDHQSA